MSDWLLRDQFPHRHAFVDHELSLPLRLAWRIKLNGSIVSQAIGRNGVSYVTSYRRLYAIDIDSGQVIWQFLPLQSRKAEDYSTMKASPAILRDRIFLCDDAGILYCVDIKDGSLIWEDDRYGAYDESICIYQDQLYVKTEKRDPGGGFEFGYTALRPNGDQIWFSRTDDSIFTMQAAAKDGVLIYGDGSGFAYGIDTANGEQIWKKDTKSLVHVRSLARPRRVSVFGFPMIVENRVILRAGDNRFFICLNLKTGDLIWKFESAKAVNNPMSDDRFLYFVTWDSKCGCIDIRNGNQIWVTKNEDAGLGDTFAHSALVVGDHYITGFNRSRQLVAFDTNTGRIVWAYEASGGIAAPPMLLGKKIIVGSDDSYLYCFEQADTEG